MLIKLANGSKYQVEDEVERREGIMRDRNRQIVAFALMNPPEDFEAIKREFDDRANTETILLYPNENDPSIPDEHLAPPTGHDGQELPGPNREELTGYIWPGEHKERDKCTKKAGPDGPGEYTRQLVIEMGQRYYDE